MNKVLLFTTFLFSNNVVFGQLFGEGSVSSGFFSSYEGFTHYVGEEYGGGVIFHVWMDVNGVEHGLIVDKSDVTNIHGTLWSNVEFSEIGPSAQSSWDGRSNSNAIAFQLGHSRSAAAICLISTNGGQNDWYLPSIDELSLLWKNRHIVNKTLSRIDGATKLPLFGAYLSSTEKDALKVWNFTFYYDETAYVYPCVKAHNYYFRAVRAF